MSVHLFGIRHHGPGCARSLGEALRALQPDCILVEGPPEADALAGFAGHADLTPPVALLVYAPADPQRAVFYPFAEFSPEWQALRHAAEHGVDLRFCDLPQSQRFALRAAEIEARAQALRTQLPDEAEPDAAPDAMRRPSQPRRRRQDTTCTPIRCAGSPTPPATATPKPGGTTWSSSAPTVSTCSPPSPK